MSAFRNVEPRREHRERAQPAERKKLGFLEKHKDYKLRAANFHRREDRIKALKLRAKLRNPDEFYFGMVSSKTKNGAHVNVDAAESLSTDMVKLLKTQDMAYINVKATAEHNRIEKLRSQLHGLGEVDNKELGRSHLVFVDSKEDVKEFDAAEHFDTDPTLVNRAFNRPRKETLATVAPIGEVDRETLKANNKERRAAYREVIDRAQRAKKLRVAAEHLQVQRNVMGKGKKVKVQDASGDQPAVYKWKPIRKK